MSSSSRSGAGRMLASAACELIWIGAPCVGGMGGGGGCGWGGGGPSGGGGLLGGGGGGGGGGALGAPLEGDVRPILGADVVRARADDLAVLALLDHVRGPAGGARDDEEGREHRGRDAEHVVRG